MARHINQRALTVDLTRVPLHKGKAKTVRTELNDLSLDWECSIYDFPDRLDAGIHLLLNGQSRTQGHFF